MDEQLYNLVTVGSPFTLSLGIVLVFFHPLFSILIGVGGFGTGYMYRDVRLEKRKSKKNQGGVSE